MATSERPRRGMAFFLFHMHVGTRVALRVLSPVLAFIFAVSFLFDPIFFISAVAVFIQTGYLAIGLLSAVISISVARIVAPRIYLGLNGWIRHLPVSSHATRRLAGVAIFVALLPILLVLTLFVLIASADFGISASAYLAGLPILGLTSVQSVLPVQRKYISRPLAILACIVSASGDWLLTLGGIILFVIIDLVSGPIYTVRRKSNFLLAPKGSLFNVIISWRALRLRIFIPYVLSLIILGATALFISNNTFDSLVSLRAIRFGGTLSIVIFCATLSNILAVRRPHWPWVRSLPLSAKRRILIDSAFISLHSFPLFILVILMDYRAVFPLAASLPLITVYSSQAVRRAFEYRMGASGKILLFGLLGALAISLIPLISVVFLALTPLCVKSAAETERSQKVSQWLELHHIAAGDPLSWSKQ